MSAPPQITLPQTGPDRAPSPSVPAAPTAAPEAWREDIRELRPDRPPEAWREHARELLLEVADETERVLVEMLGVDRERAAHAGYEVARAVAERLGGGTHYVPKADSMARHSRDEAIWNDYSGSNVPELVRRYRLSRQWIYRIVARMRATHLARVQPDLF